MVFIIQTTLELWIKFTAFYLSQIHGSVFIWHQFHALPCKTGQPALTFITTWCDTEPFLHVWQLQFYLFPWSHYSSLRDRFHLHFTISVRSFLFFFFNLYTFSWRIIALHYRVGLCHSSTWISHNYTHIPLEPPSHAHFSMTLWHRSRGNAGWGGWMASLTQWTWVSPTQEDSEGQGSLVCCSPWVTKTWTQMSDWKTAKTKGIYLDYYSS